MECLTREFTTEEGRKRDSVWGGLDGVAAAREKAIHFHYLIMISQEDECYH